MPGAKSTDRRVSRHRRRVAIEAAARNGNAAALDRAMSGPRGGRSFRRYKGRLKKARDALAAKAKEIEEAADAHQKAEAALPPTERKGPNFDVDRRRAEMESARRDGGPGGGGAKAGDPWGLAFITACRHGHLKLAKRLAKKGVDPDARTARGNSGLHYLAFTGDAKGCAALIDLGACVNARNSSGHVAHRTSILLPPSFLQ